MIEGVLVAALPDDLGAEYEALMEGLADETLSPEAFLEHIDQFMRRLCERTGVSYEEVYGADYRARFEEWLGGDRESPPPEPRSARC